MLARGTALLFAAPAAVEITSVLGGQVDCETQGDGTRLCGGEGALAETFAGAVAAPAPKVVPDGHELASEQKATGATIVAKKARAIGTKGET